MIIVELLKQLTSRSETLETLSGTKGGYLIQASREVQHR